MHFFAVLVWNSHGVSRLPWISVMLILQSSRAQCLLTVQIMNRWLEVITLSCNVLISTGLVTNCGYKFVNRLNGMIVGLVWSMFYFIWEL